MKSEMKKLLAEKKVWKLLKQLLEEEASSPDDEDVQKFNAKTGVKFTFVSSERTEGSGDFDGWQWVFKLNDQAYAIDGFYSSYEGCEMETGVQDAYEVTPVEKTIVVWEAEDKLATDDDDGEDVCFDDEEDEEDEEDDDEEDDDEEEDEDDE